MNTFLVSSVEPVAFAAHDAAEAERPGVVGDHAHGLIDGVLLAVEPEELLDLACRAARGSRR